MIGVVRGMEYVHSKNILLRDLKPHNIGFDHFGKVKIFDFGLARELSPTAKEDTDNPPRCDTGIAGTLRYIAPENALGHKSGLPSDVYSFAILFYEVITLQVPFSEIKLVAHFKEQVIRGQHRPDLKYVPTYLQDLLSDSWDANPNKRPSFPEIRSILEEILAAELLTKDGEWRKFAFQPTKLSNIKQCAECGLDNSAGSGHVRSLNGSQHHHHHHHHHASGSAGHYSHEHVDIKYILQEIRAEEEVAAAQQAGMPESHHGGLNDQMRSLTDNISFNSRGSGKVRPVR